MAHTEVYRLIEEYVYHMEGCMDQITGKIYFQEAPESTYPYMWWISHHYRPRNAIGLYFPSRLNAATEREAKMLLESYLSGFEDAEHIERTDRR